MTRRRNPPNPQVDTPAFKRWFGKSKVVDAKGEPLVVYHGTQSSFEAFGIDLTLFGGVGRKMSPTWFTANPEHAAYFAQEGGRSGSIMPVYLSIQRPLVVKDAPAAGWRDEEKDKVLKKAKRGRYDGVIFPAMQDLNAGVGDTYVVFEPTQVKSAIGNVGTFDPDDPSIYRNPRGDTALRTDPELWEEVKASVLAGSKGGRPGQWSARKAQLAVAIYKQEGGGYVGPKSPANSLARWTRQKWRTKSGRPSLETGERYLPAAAIAALTPAEYAATTRAKRAGMKQGQQFVPQPEKVALKVRPYRRRNPRRPISKARFLELLADPTTRRATRRFLRALEDYQSIEVAKEGFRDAYTGLPEEVREAIAPPARGMKQLWRGDDGQSKRDVLSWTRHPQYAKFFGHFLFNSGRDLVGYDAAVDPSRVRALIANTPLEDEFYIKDDEGEVILIGPRWKRTLTSAELRARHLA
jgi:hypothetical protein